MRLRIKACLISIVIVVVLLLIFSGFMNNTYVFLRINPDFTINTQYVDLDFLTKDTWTSMEQTSFENGVITSSTRFEKSLFSEYSVIHSESGNPHQRIALIGHAPGDFSRYEYVEGYDRNKEIVDENDSAFLYVKGSYTVNDAGNIDSFYSVSGPAYQNAGEMLKLIRVEYDTEQNIQRQTAHLQDNTLVGYRHFYYDDQGNVVKSEDYSDNGELHAYAEYIYDTQKKTVTHYTPQGDVRERITTEYDILGRIQMRSVYDSTDNLIGAEEYHYRFWELYQSVPGYIILFIVLSLAATVGVSISEDRVLRHKQENTE